MTSEADAGYQLHALPPLVRDSELRRATEDRGTEDDERASLALPVVRSRQPNAAAAMSPTKQRAKNHASTALPSPTPASKSPPSNQPRLPTPTTRLPTPPTANSTNQSTKPTPTNSTNQSSKPTPTTVTTFHSKLNALQTADLLKGFWGELLQNHTKPVHKLLAANHLKTLDFNSPSVRYAPNADASPLHICAQYGFLHMAKMLVSDFQLSATARNKVGSTPLHVACKFGKTDVVSWLIDELRVPLLVPDGQHHTALDVAPFAVIDKCVLSPLRTALDQLKQRERQLMDEHDIAQQRLWDAELLYRRNAMTLNDTLSYVEEERVKIEAVGAVERAWHEEYCARQHELDTLIAEYTSQCDTLQVEQAQASELFEGEVRQVQERYVAATSERDQLVELVDTTQVELDRRRQLLVDQLGVFDMALDEFAGSPEIQTLALTTLSAVIFQSPEEEALDAVQKEELVLRPETVDVIRHVLTAFPSDYKLQMTAVELLIAVQTLHSSTEREVPEAAAFVRAMADSDLLLVLAQTLARWANEGASPSSKPLYRLVLEAMYHCLRLPRNAQRLLTLCQYKPALLLPLRTLEASNEWASVTDWCHAALVVVAQLQYGVKKVLLASGAIQTLFTVVEKLSVAQNGAAIAVETLQNVFMALTMLTTQSGRDPNSTSRSPALLEELTIDPSAFQASTVINALRNVVFQSPVDASSATCGAWGFKLLLSLVQHGGETARGIHQELAESDAFSVVCDGLSAIQTLSSDADTRHSVIQAGLDLVQAVWIENYDHLGRVLSASTSILTSVTSIVIKEAQFLVNGPTASSDQRLPQCSDLLRVLVRAASTPKNTRRLNALPVSINDQLLRVILAWVVRYVDETGASYREPRLVELLVLVLKLFYLLSHEQRPDTVDDAAFDRRFHSKSREVGVCAVLKLFQTLDSSDSSPCPPEWTTLHALCSHIRSLVHCTC